MLNGKQNRRAFLKISSKTALTGVTALSFPSIITSKTAAAPPNVIFIISDQMRGDALSCLGNPNARTPSLDRMAKRGVLFKNCFSNNPICVPSRKSYFSGVYPHQHGSLTNKSGTFLDKFDGTILGYFRSKGYRLGWVGKNHTYDKSLLTQLDYCQIKSREPFRKYNKFVPPYWHSDTYWPSEKCYPHLNTAQGIKFIQNAKKDQPFFLHLSYFDPHPPYFAPSEYSSRYCAKQMKLPEYIPPEQLSKRLKEQQLALRYNQIKDSDLQETMRYYYAAIEGSVDYQVGKILNELQKNELAENTIVIFAADHGDFMGDHRMVRKGMFLYDALLHIPMIWYAPGFIAKDIRSDAMVQGVDLFPTLIDFFDGKEKNELPGKSLKHLLQGEKEERDDFSVFASAAYSDLPAEYFNNPEPTIASNGDRPFHSRVEDLTWKAEQRTASIRTRNWRFILNESREPELFQMGNDWRERKNVADIREFRDIRQKFEKEIQNIWRW